MNCQYYPAGGNRRSKLVKKTVSSHLDSPYFPLYTVIYIKMYPKMNTIIDLLHSNPLSIQLAIQ
jgi:hypothetical protein